MTKRIVRIITRVLPALALGVFIGSTFQAHNMHPDNGSHIVVPRSSAPVWNKALAARFPNCHDIDSRPEHVTPNEVVLVPLDGGKAYREDFGFAWAHRHSGQFFTVGYCQ